jgi:hypothetical protein
MGGGERTHDSVGRALREIVTAPAAAETTAASATITTPESSAEAATTIASPESTATATIATSATSERHADLLFFLEWEERGRASRI